MDLSIFAEPAILTSIVAGGFALLGVGLGQVGLTIGPAISQWGKSRRRRKRRLGHLLVGLMELRDLHLMLLVVSDRLGMSYYHLFSYMKAGGGNPDGDLFQPLLAMIADLSEIRPSLAAKLKGTTGVLRALNQGSEPMGLVIDQVSSVQGDLVVGMNNAVREASQLKLAEIESAIKRVAWMHGLGTWWRIKKQLREKSLAQFTAQLDRAFAIGQARENDMLADTAGFTAHGDSFVILGDSTADTVFDTSSSWVDHRRQWHVDGVVRASSWHAVVDI